MTHTLYKGFITALLLLFGWNVLAQSDSIADNLYVEKTIDYNTYLALIINNNLAFAAEKFNVDIAEANVKSAHSFPDPELSFEGTDNGERRMKMGYEFAASLDWTLELGGKRKS